MQGQKQQGSDKNWVGNANADDSHQHLQQQQQQHISPYNSKNVLLSEQDLNRFLKAYNSEFYERHPVKDVNTFRKAFTHRSYCTRKNENFLEGNVDCPRDCIPLQEESNERLEFLGDAVLNLVAAEYLYERYPDENEGFLTRMRSKLVNGDMLNDLCLMLGLNKHVLISRQIEEGGGRKAKNILEDCFEAFIGAMFLDAGRLDLGYNAAKDWLVNFLESNIDFSELMPRTNSFKDQLIKYFQHAYNCAPRFSIDENNVTGEFTVCVKTREDAVVGLAVAATRKAAENEASRLALIYFGQIVGQ